ncbi:MAG: hypothetical protein ACPGWR_14795 [Ardenticatenaceae bacterium]
MTTRRIMAINRSFKPAWWLLVVVLSLAVGYASAWWIGSVCEPNISIPELASDYSNLEIIYEIETRNRQSELECVIEPLKYALRDLLIPLLLLIGVYKSAQALMSGISKIGAVKIWEAVSDQPDTFVFSALFGIAGLLVIATAAYWFISIIVRNNIL